MTTDHDLMLAVRQGDLDKLGVLFEKHHRHLYNFFVRQTRDRQTSEDLVQEVFLKMLNYRHTYRAEGKFTTWMFAIAHNAKNDHYKKHKHRETSIDAAHGLAHQGPDPEEVSEQKSQTALLRKALAQLSEEKREVLLLSRFQGLKYEEIAQIVGCKVGTVKARVHWALKDLTHIYHALTGEA